MSYTARNYVDMKLEELEGKMNRILVGHGFQRDEVMDAYKSLTSLLPACSSDPRNLMTLQALHTKLESIISILQHKADNHE
jgi:Lon protease-like protein